MFVVAIKPLCAKMAAAKTEKEGGWRWHRDGRKIE
jgi:hypothetical protein